MPSFLALFITTCLVKPKGQKRKERFVNPSYLYTTTEQKSERQNMPQKTLYEGRSVPGNVLQSEIHTIKSRKEEKKTVESRHPIKHHSQE